MGVKLSNNMVASFIHLKGGMRLKSKTSNVIKLIEAEFFP
jgi:hypothetical protein